tara:strand:- start:10217 stop:12142 length:1926 start_codon:yes stop_codon:yes gene_type:complete
MRLFFLLLLYINVFIVSSQEIENCFVNNKKYEKLLKKMNDNLSHYTFSEVDKILKEIINEEGVSAQILDFYALIYFLKDDFQKSRSYSSKVLEFCPDNFSNSNFIMGFLSYEYRDYDLSVDLISTSLSLGLNERFNDQAVLILERASILSKIMNDTVPYNPEIVEGISTEADEYLPLISPDQEMVFFTRKGKIDEYGLFNKKSEDFIYSTGNLDNFNSGEQMPYPFNQNNNEGGASISIDNKFLYFTICSKYVSSYNNCDIYYVEKLEDGKWSDLISLESINQSKSWESQPSISPDGKTLIFASDRKGGFGGIDLYFVKKDENGFWGQPINMGSVINSRLNEKSPFMHIDGETLYFSSQQFPSLGGYDIFYSKKGDDGQWQNPKNIGFPINTEYDDLGMFVTTDGKTAYFCSNKLDGVGGWDLYSFSLHEKIQPEKVLFIKGDIKDSDGTYIDSVSIKLKNITTNEITEISVNGGKYVSALTLDTTDDILITFNKKGYAFNSHYISHTDERFSSPAKLDVEIDKLEKGKTFEINNIYFETNSFEINKVSEVILFEFSDYLIKNPNLEIEISGHTDNIGSREDNLILSTNRAKSVYEFLINNGVDARRLSYVGYGEDMPIYDNNTVEGRSKNRRTECTIIQK